MPCVSVLLPVHNGLPFLRQAVQSLLEQTLTDIEMLALDDASTDGSGAYLDSIQDPRLRVIHLPRLGLSRALNIGLQEARAPLAARMDADDVALPERLLLQFEFLRQHPDVVVCGCQADIIDHGGSRVGQMRYECQDALIRYRLLAQAPFPHPGV